LDFDVPGEAYDTTVVPVTGIVVIGTTFDDTPDNPELGCPINAAEVCLVDKLLTKRNMDGEICEKTDSSGRYTLPALIGSKVGVVVKYRDHIFEPGDATKLADYEEGITIEAGRRYINHNFVDGKVDTFHRLSFLV
jgi:hypothetical protein